MKSAQLRQRIPLRAAVFITAALVACTSARTAPEGAPLAASRPASPRSELDTYVEQAMRDWSVPGVAIAIVKDDAVVHARGYGVLQHGRTERVDADTLFAIGSCTKAFTATALAILVEEKKLEWDQPVVGYMPQFHLADPYATRNATVRDLLLNRSGAPGIAGGEVALYAKTKTSEELLEQIAALPGWPFRHRFDYSNGMYLAAGELIPAVTGKSYHHFIRERLFTPLGMTRSTTRSAELSDRTNVAVPHRISGNVSRVVAPFNVDHLAPAGSISSSASEIARWLRLQLAGGRIGSRSLLSPTSVAQTHEPAAVIPRDALWTTSFPAADILTWAMGWTVYTYRGSRIVEHVGIGGGMHAAVGLIPAHGLGVAILTNAGYPENQLPAALRYRIYDSYLADESRQLLHRPRSADNVVPVN